MNPKVKTSGIILPIIFICVRHIFKCMSSRDDLSERITIRLSKKLKDLIEKKAEDTGVTPSQKAREMLNGCDFKGECPLKGDIEKLESFYNKDECSVTVVMPPSSRVKKVSYVEEE